MTERIYYTESTQTEFDATITHVAERDGRTVAVLDRTAFYPTSGGQPFDTGVIGERRVVEVTDGADGKIEHWLEGSVAVGQRVHGRIDWPRRFDHMQQHTGQHVLSAAFDRLHAAQTVGFHLGSTASTIDLGTELSADAIRAAEAEANRIVWENHPVQVRFASADEVATLPLRKEPVKSGHLRLVEVEGFDLSACGGTHVGRTGAIGLIAISSSERFRKGIRISFLCGRRVLDGFRQQRDAVSGSITLLSVLPADLPDAIAKLQSEQKAQQRVIRSLRERLSTHEAATLAAQMVQVGRLSVLVTTVSDSDAAGLKRLAAELTMRPARLVALFSETQPALVVMACAEDVTFDARTALGELIRLFGGRGGGKPNFVQGGGLAGEVSDLLVAARQAVAMAR